MNRDFLLAHYKKLHNFYIYDLESRFTILQIYATMVVAMSGIAAFIFEKVPAFGVAAPRKNLFLCVMFAMTFFAGLVVIEFLIVTKRTLIRLLSTMRALQTHLGDSGALNGVFGLPIEATSGAAIPAFREKTYLIDLTAILCVSQLLLLALVASTMFDVDARIRTLAVVLVVLAVLAYVVLQAYVRYRLRDRRADLEAMEVKS